MLRNEPQGWAPQIERLQSLRRGRQKKKKKFDTLWANTKEYHKKASDKEILLLTGEILNIHLYK